MKRFKSLIFVGLAVLLMGAVASTSIVYVNTSTRAITGNLVVGSGTSITVTGTGNITSTIGSITGGTATGLTSFGLRSTGAAFDLKLASSEVITANRTVGVVTGDAARTVTLSGNPTLADWFDQSVKVAANPTFATITASGATASTSTTTGSGIFGGGVGIAGDMFIGGNLNASQLVFTSTGTNNSIFLRPNGTGTVRMDTGGGLRIESGDLLVTSGNVSAGQLIFTSTTVNANAYMRANGSGFVRVDTGSGFRVESGTLNVTTTGAAAIQSAGGIVSISPSVGIGYATGAGGTVSQGTSRTTAVTLNKTTGAITLFSAAGSATAASFTVNNTSVAATDTIQLSVKSGTNKYLVYVTAVAASSFEITFQTTGGTSTDAPVINFVVLKAVTS
jgi:hypothetical protein